MQTLMKIFRNNKVRLILFGLAVAFTVYFFTGRTQIKSINVKSVSIENRIVEKTVSASGIVESDKDVNLAFGVSGYIYGVYVNKGDTVKKGDLLAEIDSLSLLESVRSARDSRDVALRDLDLYIQKYENHKNDVGGNDEYAINIRRLEELVSYAQNLYESKLALLNDTDIYAPFDSTVYDILKNEGENATVNETIIKLADLDNMIYKVELDQEDFGQVKLGKTAEIELDAYPDVIFKGKVTELPQFADGQGSARFIVEVSFDTDINNPDLKPLLGMTGDVHILVASTEKEVPALYYDQVYTDESNKTYIWVVDKGLITKKYIDVGLEGDIYFEIISTIENQIVAPLNEDTVLKDGYSAKIVK